MKREWDVENREKEVALHRTQTKQREEAAIVREQQAKRHWDQAKQ
jgi:hypothetical protein